MHQTLYYFIVTFGLALGRHLGGNVGAFAGGVIAFAGWLLATDLVSGRRSTQGYWLRHRGAFLEFLSAMVGIIVGIHFYNGVLGSVGGFVAGSCVGQWLGRQLAWAGESLEAEIQRRLECLAVLCSAATLNGELSEREQRELLGASRRLFANLGYATDADAHDMLRTAGDLSTGLNVPALVCSLSTEEQGRLHYELLRVLFSNRRLSHAKCQWLRNFYESAGLLDRSLLKIYDAEQTVFTDHRDRWLAELGLTRSASSAEIDAAYRKAANDYHPDRLRALPPQILALSKSKMAALNEAYRHLKSCGRSASELNFQNREGRTFVPVESQEVVCRCWLCQKTNRLPPAAKRESARCRTCHALLGLCD